MLNSFDFFEDDNHKERLVNEKKLWRDNYKKSIDRQNRKWSKRLLKESNINKLPDLKLLCRIGVPALLRPDVWFNVSQTFISYKSEIKTYGIY